MPFTLPDLPYDKDAFGDTISAETFDFHHGKHHKTYVDKTNVAIADDKALSGAKLSDVIAAAKEKRDKPLFNNSAQLWNHSFYWQCLSPDKQEPSGKLKTMIDDEFGSLADFNEAFKKEAVEHFASGWAWLVLDKDKLKITSLHDADTPAVHDMAPLLTLDVWEHAYYIDYRNERPKHIEALLDHAINWEFVALNLDGKGVARVDQ